MRTAVLTLVLLLCSAAPAAAAWFPAETVDGPSPEIAALGGIDVARDGTGAVVYVKHQGGVPRVFLSRLAGGAFQPPVRVDAGVDLPASQPVVAAGDGGRLVVAWVAAGRLIGAHAPSTQAPLSAPELLHDPGAEGLVANPDVDLGVNDTAYVVFTASAPGGSDVRAVRLSPAGWEAVPAPLDIDPAQAAGGGPARPQVAVSAEGYAVAVWGETHPDGRNRLYGRRLTGLRMSVPPQEVSLPHFEGAGGGHADSADLDIEDDGSYAWAVFRQDFGGRSRAVARRLVGSQWEPPVGVDGGGPAETPRIAMSSRGVGIAASGGAASRAVQASLLERDVFGPSLRVDASGSTAPPLPVVAATERDEQGVAWRAADAAGFPSVIARYRPRGKAYDPEARISVPAWGPAAPDGLSMSEDRIGDMAVAFLQGPAEARRLVVAVWDRPPGPPVGRSPSTRRWVTEARPRLKWAPGVELWGPTTFRVMIDGREVTAVSGTGIVHLPEGAVRDGRHRWWVVAEDRRGQQRAMTPRTLLLDANGPRIGVRVAGARRAGRPLSISVRARDGRGVRAVSVRYGDGSRRVRSLRSVHAYRRKGTYRLRVRAVDRLGNVSRKSVRLRIR